MKYILRIGPILLSAVLLIVFQRAGAQTAGVGALTGTLTDASGGIVPAAAIAIKNDDTGETRAVTSNGAGIYFATFLQPGNYELTANKTGFTTVVLQGLTLHVGQTLTIDFQLPLQATSESVNVTGETPSWMWKKQRPRR